MRHLNRQTSRYLIRLPNRDHQIQQRIHALLTLPILRLDKVLQEHERGHIRGEGDERVPEHHVDVAHPGDHAEDLLRRGEQPHFGGHDGLAPEVVLPGSGGADAVQADEGGVQLERDEDGGVGFGAALAADRVW